MKRVFMIAAAIAVAACAAKSTTAPAQFNVSGDWAGSMSDALLGASTVSFALTQTGDSVTGTWATVYADTTKDIGGSVVGNVVGSTLTMLLKPASPPTCQYGPFQFTATESSATTLAGTFSAVQCPIADSGSISVAIR